MSQEQKAGTPKKKKEHPNYKKMCTDAIISSNNGKASLNAIIIYLQNEYPSSEYRISSGTRFHSAIARALKTDIFIEENGEYKMDLKKLQQTSRKKGNKNVTKAEKPPVQNKHPGTFGKYMCCEEKYLEHKIDIDHMEIIHTYIDQSVEQKLKEVPQWTVKMKENFDQLDVDNRGMIEKNDLVDLLITAGYTATTAAQQLEPICSKIGQTGDNVTFEQVMIA
eukprot:22726_1